MITKYNLSVAAILLLGATSAQAEGGLAFNGVASLSFTSFNNDNSSTNQTAFNMVADVKFLDQFSLGVDYDYGHVSISELSATLNRFQLEPTYHFKNGAYAGAYYQDASFSSTPLGVDVSSTGVFGGYDVNAWAIDAYVGKTTLDFLGASLSSNNYGVTVTLRPAENLEIAGHYAAGEPEGGLGASGKISVSALGAEYSIQKGLLAYAAFEKFSFTQLDVTATAIGASYDFSANGQKVPGTLNVELGHSDVQDGSLTQNQLTVAWLIPLGNGSAQPLSSILRTAHGGTRSPIIAGIGSTGVLGMLFGAIPPNLGAG
jgi:hypothetical protein